MGKSIVFSVRIDEEVDQLINAYTQYQMIKTEGLADPIAIKRKAIEVGIRPLIEKEGGIELMTGIIKVANKGANESVRQLLLMKDLGKISNDELVKEIELIDADVNSSDADSWKIESYKEDK